MCARAYETRMEELFDTGFPRSPLTKNLACRLSALKGLTVGSLHVAAVNVTIYFFGLTLSAVSCEEPSRSTTSVDAMRPSSRARLSGVSLINRNANSVLLSS